jgi:hypothetical protein
MTWLIFKFTYKTFRAQKMSVVKSLQQAFSAAFKQPDF